MTTLVVTNDFPPRLGGIETFVATVCGLLDDDVVVLASRHPGWRSHDARLPYPVHRLGYPMLPTPPVAVHAARLLRAHGCTRVLFGAAAPLALLAPTLRRAGAQRIVALTHGHETWWAQLPVSRSLLKRIGDDVDVLTAITQYTADVIGTALSPDARARLTRLAPPVDTGAFTPSVHRARQPIVLAPGRLVRRKGVATLLAAWPAVLRQVPDAELWVVGDGPQRASLGKTAKKLRGVRMVGARSHDSMPSLYAQARVCALPVRTLARGLDAEGLGIVFLEAAAAGLPVLVGRSGGAPEAVIDDVTGRVLDPRDVPAWTAALVQLLLDDALAARLGAAGRQYVQRSFSPALARATLVEALALR